MSLIYNIIRKTKIDKLGEASLKRKLKFSDFLLDGGVGWGGG